MSGRVGEWESGRVGECTYIRTKFTHHDKNSYISLVYFLFYVLSISFFFLREVPTDSLTALPFLGGESMLSRGSVWVGSGAKGRRDGIGMNAEFDSLRAMAVDHDRRCIYVIEHTIQEYG